MRRLLPRLRTSICFFFLIFKLLGSAVDVQCEHAALVANPAPAENDYYGMALATLTLEDSYFLFVGADGVFNGTGTVHAFQKATTDSDWEFYQSLSCINCGEDEYFGASIATDGNEIVAVGATQHLLSGAVLVFSWNETASSWFSNTTLAAQDGEQNDKFSHSVSFSGTSRIVVGAYGDDSLGEDAGAAYIFTFLGLEGWTLEAKLQAPDGTKGALFGHSIVGLGPDIIIVGAHGDDTMGYYAGCVYAFLYSEQSHSWNIDEKIVFDHSNRGDAFGQIVISLASSQFVAGASGHKNHDNRVVGAAYVVTRLSVQNSSYWTITAQLDNPDEDMHGGFAHDLTSVGGYALLAYAPTADYEDIDGSFFESAGALYTFHQNPYSLDWEYGTVLYSPTPYFEDYFGKSTAAIILGHSKVKTTTALAVGTPYKQFENGQRFGQVYGIECSFEFELTNTSQNASIIETLGATEVPAMLIGDQAVVSTSASFGFVIGFLLLLHPAMIMLYQSSGLLKKPAAGGPPAPGPDRGAPPPPPPLRRRPATLRDQWRAAAAGAGAGGVGPRGPFAPLAPLRAVCGGRRRRRRHGPGGAAAGGEAAAAAAAAAGCGGRWARAAVAFAQEEALVLVLMLSSSFVIKYCASAASPAYLFQVFGASLLSLLFYSWVVVFLLWPVAWSTKRQWNEDECTFTYKHQLFEQLSAQRDITSCLTMAASLQSRQPQDKKTRRDSINSTAGLLLSEACSPISPKCSLASMKAGIELISENLGNDSDVEESHCAVSMNHDFLMTPPNKGGLETAAGPNAEGRISHASSRIAPEDDCSSGCPKKSSTQLLRRASKVMPERTSQLTISSGNGAQGHSSLGRQNSCKVAPDDQSLVGSDAQGHFSLPRQGSRKVAPDDESSLGSIGRRSKVGFIIKQNSSKVKPDDNCLQARDKSDAPPVGRSSTVAPEDVLSVNSHQRRGSSQVAPEKRFELEDILSAPRISKKIALPPLPLLKKPSPKNTELAISASIPEIPAEDELTPSHLRTTERRSSGLMLPHNQAALRASLGGTGGNGQGTRGFHSDTSPLSHSDVQEFMPPPSFKPGWENSGGKDTVKSRRGSIVDAIMAETGKKSGEELRLSSPTVASDNRGAKGGINSDFEVLRVKGGMEGMENIQSSEGQLKMPAGHHDLAKQEDLHHGSLFREHLQQSSGSDSHLWGENSMYQIAHQLLGNIEEKKTPDMSADKPSTASAISLGQFMEDQSIHNIADQLFDGMSRCGSNGNTSYAASRAALSDYFSSFPNLLRGETQAELPNQVQQQNGSPLNSSDLRLVSSGLQQCTKVPKDVSESEAQQTKDQGEFCGSKFTNGPLLPAVDFSIRLKSRKELEDDNQPKAVASQKCPSPSGDGLLAVLDKVLQQNQEPSTPSFIQPSSCRDMGFSEEKNVELVEIGRESFNWDADSAMSESCASYQLGSTARLRAEKRRAKAEHKTFDASVPAELRIHMQRASAFSLAMAQQNDYQLSPHILSVVGSDQQCGKETDSRFSFVLAVHQLSILFATLQHIDMIANDPAISIRHRIALNDHLFGLGEQASPSAFRHFVFWLCVVTFYILIFIGLFSIVDTMSLHSLYIYIFCFLVSYFHEVLVFHPLQCFLRMVVVPWYVCKKGTSQYGHIANFPRHMACVKISELHPQLPSSKLLSGCPPGSDDVVRAVAAAAAAGRRAGRGGESPREEPLTAAPPSAQASLAAAVEELHAACLRPKGMHSWLLPAGLKLLDLPIQVQEMVSRLAIYICLGIPLLTFCHLCDNLRRHGSSEGIEPLQYTIFWCIYAPCFVALAIWLSMFYNDSRILLACFTVTSLQSDMDSDLAARDELGISFSNPGDGQFGKKGSSQFNTMV